MGQADGSKDQKDQKEKAYDPLESFRGMRDAYLGAMAKSMTEAVNTEAYAQATGSLLDNYLTLTGPAKDALDRSMLQALEQLSLPSRADVLSLAERFTNLELRIDDMDAKLDQLLQQRKREHATPAPEVQSARPAKASRTAASQSR